METEGSEHWGFLQVPQCQVRAAFVASTGESDQPGGFKLSSDGTSPPSLPKLGKGGSSKMPQSSLALVRCWFFGSCRTSFIQWLSMLLGSAGGGTRSSGGPDLGGGLSLT